MEKIKRFFKKHKILYAPSRVLYWKAKELKEKIMGTKAQERFWEKRHFLVGDDWEENKDWVMGYWNSRFHSHRAVLIDKILQHRFSRVLEIGSNCGPNLYLLSGRRPEAEFVGIDINKRAVEVGNDLFSRTGPSNVKLMAARADELGFFKDKSFDIVFTDATLLYIGPDKIKKVASEMERLASKAIIMLEHHSGRETALGRYNKGNWLRNYQFLFYPVARRIEVTKISPELWGGDWGKLGHLIEVRLK